MKKKYIFFLVVCGLAMPLVVGVWNRDYLAHKSIAGQLAADTYQGGSDGHVGTAINLMVYHSFFGSPDNPFFGLVPRSPVYSLVVLLSFLLFGIHIWTPWVMNIMFLLFALISLYAISTRYLKDDLAVLPPLMLALFWGSFGYVWIINTEMLTLFAVTFFVLSLTLHHETHKTRWMVSSAFSICILVLNKAIIFYFIPVAIGILLFLSIKRGCSRKAWKDIFLFFIIVVVIIGGWRVILKQHLGSSDFSRGGHQFLVHAQSAEFHSSRLQGFIISQFMGDYITNFFVLEFAEHPEPLGIARQTKKRWTADRLNHVSELLTDQKFWHEGKQIVLAHPFRFLSVAPVWFVRLNGPVFFNLATIDHMFVGTHSAIPQIVKLIILLSIYFLWFCFIALVFWQCISWMKVCIKNCFTDDRIWIVALIMYVNIMYSFFTTTEVRYLLPVMPFYFLLFVDILARKLTSRQSKR